MDTHSLEGHISQCRQTDLHSGSPHRSAGSRHHTALPPSQEDTVPYLYVYGVCEAEDMVTTSALNVHVPSIQISHLKHYGCYMYVHVAIIILESKVI